MSVLSLPRARPRAGRLLRQVASWWMGELAGLLPRPLVGWLGKRGHARVRLVFDSANPRLMVHSRQAAGPTVIPLAHIEEATAFRLRQRFGAFAASIQIEPSLLFETVVELPAAAERSIEPILRHQLERLVPLDPDTLRFGWHAVERIAGRNIVRVRVVITKQATLERALALAARIGLLPREATGGAVESVLLWQANLDGRSGRSHRRSLRRGLEVLAGTLAVSAYGLQVQSLEARRTVLRAAVAEGRQQATAIKALEQQATQADQSLSFVRQRRAAPAPLAILNSLARLLPHDSWVSEFQLHGGEVAVTGYARRATDVIARIEHAAAFSDPTFRAPVTLSADAVSEHFEIAFRVKGAHP